MKKLKVLQFPIAESKGGITQYILQNWKYINKDMFSFDFATMSKKLDFANELIEQGCNIHYISCYAEENEEQFIKEFTEILSKGYDIIHLHTKQWKSFNVELIAKKIGIKKIIVHSHSTGIDTLNKEKREFEIRQHYKLRDSLTSDIATDYWACSKLASEFLFGNKIPQERIKIMKNAINVGKFLYNAKVRVQYREELNWTNFCIIGCAVRLVYQKNPVFLIELLKKLNCLNDKYRLLVVGEGELKTKLQELVKEYGLEDKVMFLGYRPDIDKILQAIDIYALPSRFEGLPIGLVEAQASGLKCICSDTVTEEVRISENIEFVPLDIDKWISTIEKLYKCVDRRDMKSTITSAGYNIEEQIKIVEAEYLRLS